MNALKWLIENRKTIGIALIITIIGIAGNLDFNDQVTIEKARCEQLGGHWNANKIFIATDFECVFKD
ncbi:MAG: hypothetical protein SOX56_09505 [[Pasteurella] mairii]|uniref:Uncharacterized protein n=1 Tax=[Pasteurella] mairii TaxID=757 RepID=A0A379B407_9PAST|nr:hypothetical protein [[Pasteurella] mairii]SUB33363.1 Uncharacterised protein [[Pasteurella] mairii]